MAIDQPGNIKILWWIIGLLTMALTGAGSTWVTRLDQMSVLRTKVEVLEVKLDILIEQGKRLKP